MHPQLDLVDELIRIFGWPALLGALVWAVRKWDAGQHDLKSMALNTTKAVSGVEDVKAQVTVLQTNHMAHLQEGIEQVAKSNDQAVSILQNIDKGIAVLVDREPRV